MHLGKNWELEKGREPGCDGEERRDNGHYFLDYVALQTTEL